MTFVPIVLDSDYDYADMGLLDVGATGDLGFSFKRPKINLPSLPKGSFDPAKAARDAAIAAARKAAQDAAALAKKHPYAKVAQSSQFQAVWKKAKEQANKTVDKARSAAQFVARKTSEGTDLVKKATNKAGSVINDIKEKGIKQVAKETMKKLGDSIADKARKMLESAKKATGAAKDALTKKYNELKNQAKNAWDAAKKAAAGVAALGSKIASGIASVKGALASGMSKLGGKIRNLAENLTSKIASVANTVAAKVRNLQSQIASKISNAVQKLKGDLNAVKNAMLGEMTQMKAELTNMVSKGFTQLRSQMANLNNAMSAKIAGLQQYVGKVIADQGKKLASMAAQNKQFFLQLRTGQKDLFASTKELVESKTDDMMSQFNAQFGHATKRFNALDQTLNRANQERSIIRNDLIKKTGSLMKQQERDTIILAAKVRGAQEKLTDKVERNTNFTKAGIAVSIASLITLAVIL